MESCRPSIGRGFADLEVLVRHRRDLRQVRDADDLTAFGEDPQLLRYHLCSPPADTGVNLIKNQRWNLIGLRQHRLDCQHVRDSCTAGRTIPSGRTGSPGFVEIRNSGSSILPAVK